MPIKALRDVVQTNDQLQPRSLPIGGGEQVVYALTAGSLLANSRVLITATAQFSNAAPQAGDAKISVGSRIVAVEYDANWNALNQASPRQVCDATFEYINPLIHHATRSEVIWDETPLTLTGAAHVQYLFMAQASSSQTTIAVKVDTNGEMQLAIFTPVS